MMIHMTYFLVTIAFTAMIPQHGNDPATCALQTRPDGDYIMIPYRAEANAKDSALEVQNEANSVFQTITIPVRPRALDHDEAVIPLTIHEVTPNNRHLLPSFERVKFEFWSLTQSQFGQQSLIRQQYHDFIFRVMVYATLEKEPILEMITREFGQRHSMELEVKSTTIIKREGDRSTSRSGTGIHFDGKLASFIKLWIPLTSIDNLCLGVGDSTKMTDRRCIEYGAADEAECVDGSEFAEVVWYQQMTMTNEDWIFFQTDKVPHYAAHLPSRQTQERMALVVELKHADPEMHKDHLEYRESPQFASLGN